MDHHERRAGAVAFANRTILQAEAVRLRIGGLPAGHAGFFAEASFAISSMSR